MLEEFKEIVAIPSHTLGERPAFEYLKLKLEKLGFEVTKDNAGEKLGGNCGNLWAFRKGTNAGTRILLSSHMDTVEPSTGATVVRCDGVLYSDSTTSLGGDDKSGVDGILEGLRLLEENKVETAYIRALLMVFLLLSQ